MIVLILKTFIWISKRITFGIVELLIYRRTRQDCVIVVNQPSDEVYGLMMWFDI